MANFYGASSYKRRPVAIRPAFAVTVFLWLLVVGARQANRDNHFAGRGVFCNHPLIGYEPRHYGQNRALAGADVLIRHVGWLRVSSLKITARLI